MFASDFEWSIEVSSFGKVRISSMLINKLAKYRQLSPISLESGGVLIGKHLNSNGVLLIDSFTPPLPTDRQSRHGYYRSRAHNDVVRKLWKETERESTYVGLWHTHPEDCPNYSPIDKTDWMKALKTSRYEGTKLFFFIIGNTKIRCWLGFSDKSNCTIKFLSELKFDN